jgi:phosphopantothenoylcysteine decarboxylase/phosphopantothenate--cysteine ligase
VTLLAANLAVAPPAGVEVVEAGTARELLDAARGHAAADLVLMAAAVADYRPAEPVEGKRAKGADGWTVVLEPTADIVRELAAARHDGQVIVAFGAERGEEGLERKRRMLTDKQVDLVVYNDVSRDDIGFDAPDNEVVLISAAGEERVPKASKARIATAVLDAAERLLRGDGR